MIAVAVFTTVWALVIHWAAFKEPNGMVGAVMIVASGAFSIAAAIAWSHVA